MMKTAYQNLHDIFKAVIGRKFIALDVINKNERVNVNEVSVQKTRAISSKSQPKMSLWRGVVKLKAETNVEHSIPS